MKPESEKVSSVAVPRAEVPETFADAPLRSAATTRLSSDGSVQAHSPESPDPGARVNLSEPIAIVTLLPVLNG